MSDEAHKARIMLITNKISEDVGDYHEMLTQSHIPP